MLDLNIKRKNKMQDEDLANQTKSGLGPVFSHIELSINGLCNRKCHFCPRNNPEIYESKNEYMELNLWEKLVKELSERNYTGRLSFSGFSEPLIHRDIIKMASVKKRYLEQNILEMVTNGDLLTENNAKELLNSGMDKILISMYDGDHQIEMFEKLFKNIEASEERYILRKRYLSETEQYGLTFSNRAGSVEAIESKELPLKKKCYYTHYRMMINHNGDVLLCPHDWQSKIIAGNIKDENIFDIWYGEKLSYVRERLAKADRDFAPCNKCDVDGTLQGQAHYEAWVNR